MGWDSPHFQSFPGIRFCQRTGRARPPQEPEARRGQGRAHQGKKIMLTIFIILYRVEQSYIEHMVT